MGVPFNFTCEGVGHYICSRCGQELFSSDDRIPKKEKPFPISFSKAIEENSVVKIPHPTPPRRRYATSTSRPSIQARGAAEIACGRCGVKIGYECQSYGRTGQSFFDIEWKSLLFVPRKQCAIPWSFLF